MNLRELVKKLLRKEVKTVQLDETDFLQMFRNEVANEISVKDKKEEKK